MKGNLFYKGNTIKWKFQIVKYTNDRYHGCTNIWYGKIFKFNLLTYNISWVYDRLIYAYSNMDKEDIINEIENKIIEDIEFREKEKQFQ